MHMPANKRTLFSKFEPIRFAPRAQYLLLVVGLEMAVPQGLLGLSSLFCLRSAEISREVPPFLQQRVSGPPRTQGDEG